METAPPVRYASLCSHNKMKLAHAQSDLSKAAKALAWAQRPDRQRSAAEWVERAKGRLAKNREQYQVQPKCEVCSQREARPEPPPTDFQLDLMASLPDDFSPTEPTVLNGGRVMSARLLAKRGFLTMEDGGKVRRASGDPATGYILTITEAGLEMLRRCRG